MQAAERDGAAGSPEGVAAGGEAPPELSSPRAAAAFDLLELVRSYRRLELYLEPLRDAAEGVRSLLRWQRPVCSLLVCLGLNFLLLTLGQAAWYSVLALSVVVPALLGYLQEVCRARPSELELLHRRYHSVRREDLRKVQLSRQEAVAQVKSFLIQLEGFLSGMCCSCEAVYRVLYWENPTVSSQFYGALLGSVCVLYLLPLCWVLAILNSTLFLGNTQFYQVIMELKASLEQCVGTKPIESTPEPAEPLPASAPLDQTPTPTSTEDLTPGSVEEAEEAEPDEEFKDAIEENQLLVMEDDESSQCSADFDLSLPDNGFMSKNEVIRSKVSRLTERLRKRYPSNNFGSCTGCAATFSVLKKRTRVAVLLLPGVLQTCAELQQLWEQFLLQVLLLQSPQGCDGSHSPGGPEGDSVCVCSVQPGAHQVTKTGPASSWVLCYLTSRTVGALPLLTRSQCCLVPSVASPCQRTHALATPPASARLRADQPSLPRSTSWVPVLELCSCPWQLLQDLGAPWDSLGPAMYLPRPCGLAQ
ncbi:protrudin isoform X2 [Columba livia]|uniref:protrudin isoform X2 n=1 Tax=Columba livia TaxID=8932 RepID=UPI0031BAA35E